MSEIKAMRKKAGLTQQEAADRLDMNRHTFAAYERGDRTPPYPVGVRIRKELGGERFGLPDRVVPITVRSGWAGRGSAVDESETMHFDERLLAGTGLDSDEIGFVRVLGSGLEPALSHRQVAITEPVERLVGDDLYVYRCSASGGLVVGILSAVPRGIELETRGPRPQTELLRHVEGRTYRDEEGRESEIELVGRVVAGLGSPSDCLARVNEAARVARIPRA
jgi:DNA-binding XRE family transcriptional regulator